MAYIHTIKDRAIKMRSQGASFNDIAAELNVPKSTIRCWCRDIILSRRQQQKLYAKQKMGGILAAERLRIKRITLTQQLLNEGKNEIGALSPRELLVAGASLYWAEGYRKGNGEFGFTNSDPRMIRFILRWLKAICKVENERISLRICINSIHRNRIDEIRKFWSETADIPENQFTKSTLIRVRAKKRYFNQKNYYGTLRIKVRKGTNLKRKTLGWIEGLTENSS